ncbi:hypothetical protein JCM19055_4983 [Geomicrobium sp. JCM 19055]|nr:hypothetical protein JCM19055_4983 [Geomicrobium sp. JCM 19055]
MEDFKNVYDIRQFLMKYNSVIYTRDPITDLYLMEEELRALYDVKLIDPKRYMHGKLLLGREAERLQTEHNKKTNDMEEL